MENIKITDIHSEMEEIGRELFQNKQYIYTEKLQNEIYAVIEKVYPAATPEEKEGIFYRSIYDYWVYGCNINEELFYHFSEKTHKEKCEYITVKNRFPYMHHINKKEDAHLLNDKYEAYQILKPYFKRDMIEISGEYKNTADEKSFVSLVCTFGEGKLVTENLAMEIKKGESIFIPAATGEFKISGNLTVIETRV